MKLRNKILLLLVAVALLPSLMIGVIGLHRASVELETAAYEHLLSIREIKKSQIYSYFKERREELDMLSASVGRLLDFASVTSLSKSAHYQEGYFRQFIRNYGYYDLFLIDVSGKVFYTVEREADYGSDLNDGPYRTTGLANLYRQALSTGEYGVVDFAPYPPSNNEPAAFIAMPLEIRGQRIVVALQLSIERINAIMSQRDGMGESGESYLVGSDHRMRSDSYLDPVNHSIAASFAGTVAANGVKTNAVTQALAGRTGAEIIIDYNGNPVLSAYTPVEIDNIRWALMSEIDEAEAFAAVRGLTLTFVWLGVICLILVTIVAWRVSQSIMRPIGGEPRDMQQLSERIAGGDLSMSFQQQGRLTGIFHSMQVMAKGLRSMMGDIARTSEQLSSAATQTSVASSQASVSIEQQQKNIENVATAVDELSYTIRDIAANIDEVAGSTKMAKQHSNEANDVVSGTLEVVKGLNEGVGQSSQVITDLAQDSQSIGAVLEVIRNIADQTNLLALNAAIEAARAGETGRGFAVVADEVRVLAQKTQSSTKDIERVISRLQQRSQQAVEAMGRGQESAIETIERVRKTAEIIHQVDQDIDTIDGMAIMIATAGEQQSTATEEINRSLSGIKEAAEENSTMVGQTSQASEQMSLLATQMKQLSQSYQL